MDIISNSRNLAAGHPLDYSIFHKESLMNALSLHIVNAKDVNDFKSKLDRHWSHEVMYDY